MSAEEPSRFDELVSRYLDGELAEAEAAELLALLAEPPLAARFLEIARLNSEIAGILAAPVPDEAMVELVRTDIERSLANLPRAEPAPQLRIVERAQPAEFIRPEVAAPRCMSRTRRFAWSGLKWAAAFVILAGLAAMMLFKHTSFGNAPVIASSQGEVRLIGASGERVPTPGDSWQQNETLKTVGPNSRVTLKLRDGSQLDFSDSAIALKEPSAHGCRVTLEHGVLQATVKKHSVRAPFIFATPEAEARVAGTKLRIVASLHSTRLEVGEGEVGFRRRHDDKEITVKSGEYAVVAPNAPFIPRALHADPHHGK